MPIDQKSNGRAEARPLLFGDIYQSYTVLLITKCKQISELFCIKIKVMKSNAKYRSVFAGLILFISLANTASSQVTYCAAWGKSTYYEYIDYIAFGTIIRSSGAETGGYYDGTAITTDVNPGATYAFTYSHANPVGGYTEHWNVFADWNMDGDFYDADENIFSTTTYTTVNYTTNITIPPTAIPGTVRLRICMESGLYPFPLSCGKFPYGEVEDYTLHVMNPAGCAETYEPNNTKATAKPIIINTIILSQISMSGDIDWYSFSNSADAPNMMISLTTLPANYNIRLYDPSGAVAGTSAGGGLSDENIIFNTAIVGTYKLKVYAGGGGFSATNCYTLLAETNATPYRMGPALTPDEKVRLDIYPVPAMNDLTLNYTCPESGMANINIFDHNGGIVYTEQEMFAAGENMVKLDISILPKGIYFIEVIQNDFAIRKEFIITK